MWGTAQKREFGHPTLTLAVLDTVGAFLKLGPAPVVAAPVVIELKVEEVKAEPRQVHSSAELFDMLQGTESDAPLCFNCGIKMRPSGSCHVCEGCGSTSGCS